MLQVARISDLKDPAFNFIMRPSTRTKYLNICASDLLCTFSLCSILLNEPQNARNRAVQRFFSIMEVTRPILWAALLFAVVVISSELNLPRETSVGENVPLYGFSPLPTHQPMARDIFKRLDPALCGYYNGWSQIPQYTIR